jgi:hypothetical protein
MDNLYKKLAKARVELQGMSLKKSGKNKFSNFDYFELHDFLPKINDIFNGLGLCSVISFTTEVATLTIVNSDNPSEDRLTITSPMVQSELKGCTPIQSLGAVETYQRRYLYLIALEIVEQDSIDPVTGSKPESKPEPKPEPKTVYKPQTSTHLCGICGKIGSFNKYKSETSKHDMYCINCLAQGFKQADGTYIWKQKIVKKEGEA